MSTEENRGTAGVSVGAPAVSHPAAAEEVRVTVAWPSCLARAHRRAPARVITIITITTGYNGYNHYEAARSILRRFPSGLRDCNFSIEAPDTLD